MRIEIVERDVLQALRGKVADVERGHTVVADANQFLGGELVVAGRLQLFCEIAFDAVVAQANVLVEAGHGQAHALDLLDELWRDSVVFRAHEIFNARAAKSRLLHPLDVGLGHAVIAGPHELVERGAGESLGLHRLDVFLRDAVVARPHEVSSVALRNPCALIPLDVVDGDAVGLRALNLVQRQLVEALGLELADVLRARRRELPAESAARAGGRRCNPSRASQLTYASRGAKVKRPAPRPSRNEPSIARVPASRRRSNFTLDAVSRSSLAGSPESSSTEKLWPMFQSPLQFPERFQSAGGVVRTWRKTLPCESRRSRCR